MDAARSLAWNEHVTPEIRFFDATSASRAEWAALHAYRKTRGAEEFPDVPLIRYELGAFKSWYAELDRRGGEHYMVVLSAGDEVVAVSDAHWDARVPERVHQSFTAVDARWRGKGLAKAVKARTLLLVRERRPEVNTITTYNAQSNGPMLAINQRLGFRVHREECTYQLRRETLGAFLRRPGT